MKITVLVENSTSCRLYGEHGLSVYIEYDGKKYLLDTGASTLFAKNAKELGISLADIDTAFLSHAHYDHSGGFEAFFKENDKAEVYMQDTSAENCYFRTETFWRRIKNDSIHYIQYVKWKKESGLCRIRQKIWMEWAAEHICTAKWAMNSLQMILHMSRVSYLRQKRDL